MKWTKLVKAENVIDQGNFTNDEGSWKKVLDDSIEMNVLGVYVDIDVYHYETNTQNEGLKQQFSGKRFEITNMDQISKQIEKMFQDNLESELGKIQAGVSKTINLIEEGRILN